MPNDKPRLVRLTEITTLLQSKSIITATQIAEKFNVSIRTVYRDIRTLQDSGIPVLTEEGKGYSMMKGFKLPPVMFTENEANALITAEKLIIQNNDASFIKEYQNVITKIKSVLKSKQKEKTEFLSERIQVRQQKSELFYSNYLIKIQAAIANFTILDINYLSLENKKSKRLIEPFALYTTNNNWILVAFCRYRKDFRAFRIDRILNLIVTYETFTQHKITLEEYLKQCSKKDTTTPDKPLTHPDTSFAENNKTNIMENKTLPAFNIIGIAVKTTNENMKAASDIPALWQKFMEEGILHKIPNKINEEIYSMYTDYEGDFTKPYTTIIGCKVAHLKEIPKGMVAKKIESSNYSFSTTKGDLSKGVVINHWNKIWQSNLKRTYTADFEIYGEKASNPQDAEVAFYVSIL